VADAHFGFNSSFDWSSGNPDGDGLQIIAGRAPPGNFGAPGTNHRVAIKFDVSSLAGEDIVGATLKLFQESSLSSVGMNIYQITTDWNESDFQNGASGYPIPGKGPQVATWATTIDGEYNKISSADLTDLIRGWIDGTIANHGLLIETENYSSVNGLYFTSREGAANQVPILDVEVEQVPEPATILLAAAGLLGLAIIVRRRQ